MFPYYILVLFPFFLEFVETILRPNQENAPIRRNSNNSILLFFLIWFLLLAFRHVSCGVDLLNYQYHFYNISRQDFLKVFEYNPREPLYYVLNWFLAQIYPDFRLVIVVAAFLCTGIIGWFYWKESEFAPLTILLFITNACFSMFYSGMRQSFAMLFVVPAYYLIKLKKLFPFILLVVFASYFHSSALVMLFMYPIFHIPLKSKHFFIVLLLVAAFFMFKVQLFYMFVPFLKDRYADAMVVETSGYAIWIMFLLMLAYSFVILDDEKATPEILGLRNILILIALIQGFAPINPLAMRMNYYFIILFPVIIPKIMSASKMKYENVVQISKWAMVVFFTFMFFYKGHTGTFILRQIPYVAYWE